MLTFVEERHGGKLHLTIILTLSLHLAKVSLIRMHLQMPATRRDRRFHGQEWRGKREELKHGIRNGKRSERSGNETNEDCVGTLSDS